MVETHSQGNLNRIINRPLGSEWVGLSRAVSRLIDRHTFLAISALYAGLWSVFSLWHTVPFASIETDGMEYLQAAKTLFTSYGVHSGFHGLGYPAAVWLGHVFIHDWFVSAKVISGVAGLAFLLASLGLAEALLGRRAALIAGLVVVTNFFVIAYSAIAMSDMLAAALAMVGLVTIVRGSHPARYGLAAILVGLAAVTHLQYFGLILAGVLLGLLEPNWTLRLRGWAIYFGIFLLAAVALTLGNISSFGSLLANSNFANLGPWFYSATRAGQVHSWGDVFRLIAGDPGYFARGYLKSVLFDLPIYLQHVVALTMFLAPAGWMLILKQKENRAEVRVTLGFCAVYVLVTGLTWLTEARFWLFLIPFIAIGCAGLLMSLAAVDRRVVVPLVLLVLMGNAAIVAANLPHYVDEQAPEFMRAGLAIRGSAPQGAVILVSQPQIAYFAERPAVLLRDVQQSWATLPAVLSSNQVQYVVMDERYGSTHYQELETLLEPDTAARALPGWELVYYENRFPRIAVYRNISP